MKTTLEIPEGTFRRAKTLAAARGTTLTRLVTESLEATLRGAVRGPGPTEPPWMAAFGKLSDLGREHVRVLRIVEEEFERLEPADLA